jgi:hypothetical protein
MFTSVMKGRKRSIAIATAAALAAGGVAAYASIPDGNGVITSCYDSAGTVRVIDTATNTACPTNTTKLAWNMQGRQGPTGMRGPQGVPGPNNLHWIKVDKAGAVTAKSDAGASIYTGAAYVYFSITGIDPTKCAISAQPADAMFSDGPITTSYQIYSGGWVYVRAQQLHPNGSVDWYPKTGFDVQIAC